MARVKLEKLNKVFEGVHAVRDVSLTIEDEEFIVLVGPSGCGKTTTLRMVAGLEEVTSGDIYIGAERVTQLPPRDRDIAMVFQNYALYPHMSVFENMAFGLKIRKFAKDKIDRRVRQAAEILDIGELLERKPRQLSGGQRQRVAVGRAIVRQPQVFLFDEPLSNLDAQLRMQMRVELKRLHERLKSTVIYVTHDQVEAMTLGDRIVVMNHGRIQQIGAPLEVYSHPQNKFVAGFVGSPPMNFVDVSIRASGGDIYAESDGLSIKLSGEKARRLDSYKGKSVTLGIRPENMHAGGEAPCAIDAVVEVVEPLGSEILLDAQLGNHLLVARVPSSFSIKRHEKIRLGFFPESTHFFDPATEQTVA
jgi:multiple sugar transport system ATP-binding protein